MFTSLLNWLKRNPIPAFFVLTFVIAWSLWLPLGFLVPENPLLSLPGAWAPTISAIILIGLSEGRSGASKFLKKILRWRVGFQMLVGILPIIFIVNIFMGGPLAEDIGWRGYILPKMREQRTALHASLIIGIVWAIWHLPYFLFPAWRSAVGNIPFLWFALLTTSWSVLFAWVYVNTESILMPVLFHAAINTTLGTLGVLGQSHGDLIPLMVNTLLTWIAVGIIVIVYGLDLKRLNDVKIESAAEEARSL